MLLLAGMLLAADSAWAQQTTTAWPWWQIVIMLFVFTAFLGVLAVLAGVGGALIFVPLINLWTPFLHIDFIRAAGLMMTLTGALFAGPILVRQRLVNVRLAILIGVMASVGAIFGAKLGLQLPLSVLQVMLGLVVLFVASMYVMRILQGAQAARKMKTETVPGRWLGWLRLEARFYDLPERRWLRWHPRFLLPSLGVFVLVGFFSGMLGLGGGWAYVPLLNLVMGLPMRFSVATSYFIIAIVNTAALPVYLRAGAVQPLLCIPCVLGVMLGARFGSRVLRGADHYWLQWFVLVVLSLVGSRILLKGLGI